MSSEPGSGKPRDTTRVLKVILRWVVTLGLAGYLVMRVDLGAVGRSLAEARPELIAAAIALYAFDRVLAAAKWRLIYVSSGRPLRFFSALQIYLKSNFLGAALPASVGGDLVRAGMTRPGEAGSFLYALASIVLERVTGMLSLFWVVVVGLLLLAPEEVREPLRIPLLIAAATLTIASLAFVFPPRARPLRVPAFIRDRVRGFYAQARAYVTNRAMLAVTLLLAAAQHYLLSVINWTLAIAVGIDLELTTLLWVWPIVLTAIRLPISVLGFGVRELVLFGLAEQAGIDSATAVSLGLLSGGLDLVFVAVGGALFMVSRGDDELAADSV